MTPMGVRCLDIINNLTLSLFGLQVPIGKMEVTALTWLLGVLQGYTIKDYEVLRYL